MKTPEERRSGNDQRVADDIREYGCHVISVFDPDEKHPTFSYSVGIQASTGAPEAIVVGVRHQLGHAMVNAYNRQICKGVQFKRGVLHTGFLEGFSIYVEPTKRRLLSEYTLGCERYYQGTDYSVVQLIYPSTAGLWPWQAAASEWFKSNQPMLGRVRSDRE